MRGFSLSHVGDAELLRGLASLVARDRVTTARLLAHLAEVDVRRLYLPAAYPSMYAYCVGELHLSEDAAYKRIHAARTARQFPRIFEALADGRLHLTAVGLLAPYLTPGSADELMAATAHKTRAEIEELLSRRFPRSEAMGLVEALPALAAKEAAPAPELGDVRETPCQLAPERVGTDAAVAPVAPERYRIEITVGRSTRDKLRHAQDLLGHALPSGDVAQVLDRALDALIEKLERRKFAASQRPGRSGRASENPRHVPAHVKRAVWERDGGRCTFVSEAGRRCEARKLLEFDHVEEVARGGQARTANIRLRCRAHNQYGAERTFGAEFMRRKRERARERADAGRLERGARAAAAARAAVQAKGAEVRARAAADEVIAPLRVLGFNAREARRAAALCEAIPDASLEQRVRRALSYFRPHAQTVVRPSTGGSEAAIF